MVNIRLDTFRRSTLPWVFLLGLPGVADAVGKSKGSLEEPIPVAVNARLVSGGFVILNGRYLPPPYRLSRRDNALLVNGQVVADDWFAAERKSFSSGGRGAKGRRSPGARREQPRRADTKRGGLASLGRRLDNNGLLIGLDGDTVKLIESNDGLLVIGVLISDARKEEKLNELAALGVVGVTLKQWATFLESFEPTEELTRRAGPAVARINRMMKENEAVHERVMSSAIFRSDQVKYGVTISAMVLAVVAFGNLLNHRPAKAAGWGEVDTAPESVSSVVRNTSFLALLGLFDLTCTLVAERAGGFMEMNPLGSQLAADPFALISFKITTLAASCGILLFLRRYRGAQTASWWLCLVCTMLAFRWATYNSMFLT